MRRLLPPKRGAAKVRSGEVLPPLATLPAGGVGPARTEFTDGPGGPKLPFRDAMAQGAVFLDGYGAFGMGGSFGAGVVGTYGSKLQRQGPRAGAYAQEMMTADPVLAGLVKQKITSALGAGLQFSSALDWQALGMTEAKGRDVRNQINRNFKAWANDPLEVDYTGRSNLHDLAGAAFTSYLLSGEIVCTVDWMACNNAISKTKLSLLDARQLDYTRTLEGADGGCMNGVQFDKRGRVTGYWLRSVTYGALVNQPMPKFHLAFTSWKRPRVLHIFDNQQPGMVRGVSPLIASLSPAAERAMLSQYTLEKAVVEASFTATLESDLPEEVKFGGINAEGTVPFNGVTAAYMADPLGGRDAWYKQSRPSLKSGQINSLSPGEKLHFHTPGTPGNNFDPFNNSLIRQTAKAAGESYEAVSGDFQKSSYSASRLALEIPYRHMLVERRKILEKFYQAAFTVWVEEELYSGRIVLPSDAVPFWQNPNAYTLGAWRGMGRISPDPLKQAMADIALVGNQFTTRTEVLASYGLDFEEVMTTLSHEQTRMIELGLDPNVKGTITTQYKDVKEDDKIEEKAS